MLRLVEGSWIKVRAKWSTERWKIGILTEGNSCKHVDANECVGLHGRWSDPQLFAPRVAHLFNELDRDIAWFICLNIIFRDMMCVVIWSVYDVRKMKDYLPTHWTPP